MMFFKEIWRGILKDNPIFALLLGMCPTLGVTTSAKNGVGMGLATTFVLISSNLVVSLIKGVVPDKVRIPAFVVVIAAFVTMVDLSMSAYLPALHAQLGIFIPLIVVNCIILARAEAYAFKNTPINSIADGLGSGIGFTIALTILGGIREILGNGSIFDFKFVAENASTILIFVMPPGAFITLGLLIAIVNKFKKA